MPEAPAPSRLLARRPDEAAAPEAVRRAVAGIVASGCLAVLAIAAWLTPSPAGHGTHERLGMDPCGFLKTTGYPCASCGMTTSWTYAAEGRYVQSFLTQPFGFVLVLVTATVFWLALHSAVFGSRIGEAASRVIGTSLAWWAIGGLLAGWGYKIVVMT